MRRLLLAVVLVCAPALGQTWADGTAIQRFDKRPELTLQTVADFGGLIDRHWAVPSLWANRLQDWHVVQDKDGGWYECAPAEALPCRTVQLLTAELSERAEPFQIEALLRVGGTPAGFAGFLVGAGEGRLDYRGAALVHHLPGQGGGLLAVCETSGDGALQFREMSTPETRQEYPAMPGQTTLAKEPIRFDYHQLVLNLEGRPAGDGTFTLRLSVWSRNAGELLGAQELAGVPAARLRGNVALVAQPGALGVKHRFGAFRVGGAKLDQHPERTFGPIAGTLYTVSAGALKLSAQFMSLGEAITNQASREGRQRMAATLVARPLGSTEAFQTVAGPQAISPPDYYAPFRVEPWDASRAWETEVRFINERDEAFSYRTVVTADPVTKPRLSVAGFTGMGQMGRTANQPGPQVGPGEVVVGRWTPANVWMPFERAVAGVLKQDVDLLFFTGDQVYEGKPTAKDPSREPFKDYLYKWLLWHWSFRDLTNHLPAVCQPDDHDVYHGNLWGWGGRLNLTGSNGDGGYLCSPNFVNAVHRMQCGHLPEPYDPRPILNGISNYYTAFTWGGVGFAVLEDRKFKTPPAVVEPEQQELLGDTQLRFLKEWGLDWRGQTFKCAVSQTIYSGAHTNFDGQLSKDADTGAWPKAERDKAVRQFQRSGVFVLSGDQHLATFTRLGLERPGDAVYNFAVPAVGNIFWRWWYPTTPGESRSPGQPDYLGDFTDGWGNPFRMVAVANPERSELLSQKLRQRAVLPEAEARAAGATIAESGGVRVAVGLPRVCLGDGYGVVRFDRVARTVRVECWPYDADPATGKPFAGWPVVLPQADLDGRQPVAWLPDLRFVGVTDPVVMIVDQASGEVVKVTRARGATYRPGVFDAGRVYTVKVGRPEPPAAWKAIPNLKPTAKPGASTLVVRFVS